jgi:hypothetical protein
MPHADPSTGGVQWADRSVQAWSGCRLSVQHSLAVAAFLLFVGWMYFSVVFDMLDP